MKITVQFRTPIRYYGGKQRLVPYILPRIPEHQLYAEPFCGGAAIFFAKSPSAVEVLNDTNGELMNFYRVVQNDFISLEKEVRATLHSRDLHCKAMVITSHPDLFSEVKRAWALWVLSTQSFSGMLNGPWGYDRKQNITTKNLQNRKDHFTGELARRLEHVQLETTDALYIIKSRDSNKSFFYCDPPYYNADCRHYNGYTLQDFENLLDALSGIKGKFLLSSYPSESLLKAITQHGWYTWSVERKVSVRANSGSLKQKVEVLTANYPIEADS